MKKINYEQTGQIIKHKCEQNLLDAQALVKALDVSMTAPYYWFYGKVLPKWDTLINLCDMLNCRIEDLLVITDGETGEVIPSVPAWKFDDDLKQALVGGKVLKYDEENDQFIIVDEVSDDGK